MQLNASAYVATATPARYISRLCKHFAHKLPVSFAEQQGRIEFDSGLALLQAETDGNMVAPAVLEWPMPSTWCRRRCGAT